MTSGCLLKTASDMGLKTVPSVIQLPGGIKLNGIPFEIIEWNEDVSPLVFKILPKGSNFIGGKYCSLYAHEDWIRSPRELFKKL
jgi:hypothetical protein